MNKKHLSDILRILRTFYIISFFQYVNSLKISRNSRFICCSKVFQKYFFGGGRVGSRPFSVFLVWLKTISNKFSILQFYFISLHIRRFWVNKTECQPSGPGFNSSPPAMSHQLQNPKWPQWGPKICRQGLDWGPLLGYWRLQITLAK